MRQTRRRTTISSESCSRSSLGAIPLRCARRPGHRRRWIAQTCARLEREHWCSQNRAVARVWRMVTRPPRGQVQVADPACAQTRATARFWRNHCSRSSLAHVVAILLRRAPGRRAYLKRIAPRLAREHDSEESGGPCGHQSLCFTWFGAVDTLQTREMRTPRLPDPYNYSGFDWSIPSKHMKYAHRAPQTPIIIVILVGRYVPNTRNTHTAPPRPIQL